MTWKCSFSKFSGEIPTSRFTSPLGVNLTALPTSISRTRFNKAASPNSTSGIAGWTLELSRRFFLARGVNQGADGGGDQVAKPEFLGAQHHFPGLNLGNVQDVADDLHRAWTAELLTRPRYSRCSGFRSDSRTTSVNPMMPFMGVRISWLMLARNSLLARLAISATCLARTNFDSASLRAVMSVPEPITFVMTPSWSRRGPKVASIKISLTAFDQRASIPRAPLRRWRRGP